MVDFNELMYWMPSILIFAGLVFLIVYTQGISGVAFLLLVGIGMIILYLWTKYWADRKYKKRLEYA